MSKRKSLKKNRELAESFKQMAGSLDEAENGIAETFYEVAKYLPIDILLMLNETYKGFTSDVTNGINDGMEETYRDGEESYKKVIEKYGIDIEKVINGKRY